MGELLLTILSLYSLYDNAELAVNEDRHVSLTSSIHHHIDCKHGYMSVLLQKL
jgi:hypothetical protein